jgi:hypothetical protein
MRGVGNENRPPALSSYSILHVYRPDAPNVERWIDRLNHTIYVNTGAKDGANIVILI